MQIISRTYSRRTSPLRGAAKYCLGIEIAWNKGRTGLSPAGYIQDILNRFGMNDCRAVNTPLAAGMSVTVSSPVVDGVAGHADRSVWGERYWYAPR